MGRVTISEKMADKISGFHKGKNYNFYKDEN